MTGVSPQNDGSSQNAWAGSQRTFHWSRLSVGDSVVLVSVLVPVLEFVLVFVLGLGPGSESGRRSGLGPGLGPESGSWLGLGLGMYWVFENFRARMGQSERKKQVIEFGRGLRIDSGCYGYEDGAQDVTDIRMLRIQGCYGYGGY